MEVVSSRPDMVSGGTALVKIDGLRAAARGLRVSVAGRDVTAAFRPDPEGRLLGLVEGLPQGRSVIELREAGGARAALVVENHPVTGPMFSGPHQLLLACDIEAAGLGLPHDKDCSAPARVEYLYRPKGGMPAANFDFAHPLHMNEDFKPYDRSGPRPADMDTVALANGKSVDFIVRRERGTINRAIYEIESLYVPGAAAPDPWTRSPAWNGKLVYEFGGPCSAAYAQQWYLQPLNRAATVGAGFAVATSTLNVFGNDCNDVRSAETASMVKERFIKEFGVPLFTISRGFSGGSMQQELLTQDYPGLIDGMIPSNGFPDWWTLYVEVGDCALLADSIAASKVPWTEAQKRAVSGMAKWQFCGNARRTPWLGPKACVANVPKDQIYDRATRPNGVRCTVEDNMVAQVGRDPATGFARRPFDNVGVEYGLKAFNDGVITAEQFVALNEGAGGLDPDGGRIAARNAIDAATLHAYYAEGRINTASGALTQIPIIDQRTYTDNWGDVHDFAKSFAVRARLARFNGARNHIIWVAGGVADAPNVFAATSKVSTQLNDAALRTMDAWLTALKQDRSSAPVIEKIVRAKPANAVDTCFSDRFEASTDWTACDRLYPHFATPRQVAGGPVADDVLKCQLRPLDRSRYRQPLADAQWSRLEAVFPQGVCDFSRPGVGYERLSATWLRY